MGKPESISHSQFPWDCILGCGGFSCHASKSPDVCGHRLCPGMGGYSFSWKYEVSKEEEWRKRDMVESISLTMNYSAPFLYTRLSSHTWTTVTIRPMAITGIPLSSMSSRSIVQMTQAPELQRCCSNLKVSKLRYKRQSDWSYSVLSDIATPC